MSRFLLLALLSGFLLAGAADESPIPNPEMSTATLAYSGNETVVVYNRPDGGGTPFTAAAISLTCP